MGLVFGLIGEALVSVASIWDNYSQLCHIAAIALLIAIPLLILPSAINTILERKMKNNPQNATPQMYYSTEVNMNKYK